MGNGNQNRGALDFAAAFAESLSTALANSTGSPLPLEVADSTPSNEAAPIQFRLTVEGELRGECFIEFYEPQVANVLAKMIKQPVKALTEEHKAYFTKFLSTAASELTTSLNSRHGELVIRIERATGLAFGGMYVVPIVAPEDNSDFHVLLYFGAQLLAALSANSGEGGESESESTPNQPYNLRLVMDVELNASLRFGQRQLPLRELLELNSGSIIELDRMVDEPVELFLDGKMIARGEAVVVDGNYGLRVTEIPQPIASHFMN